MARVIRGWGPVVPGEVLEARDRAQRFVQEAEEKAQRIVQEAEEAAERLAKEAGDRGRAEAEAEAALLLVQAAGRRDAALAAAESEIKALAIAAAKHLVMAELEVAPHRIDGIVRDVLGRARRAREVRVHVHPEDAPGLGDALSAMEIIEDPTVSRGGCVVVTDLGKLDARLEVRLEALRERLERV